MRGSSLSSPEIIRYCRLEAKPARLMAGFITAQVVAFSVYLIATQGSDPGKQLAQQILWLQAVILGGYAAVRSVASVVEERAAKTWDFQRLTPLTSWDLAWGKFAGAPIFAYFLTAVLTPWAIFGTAVARDFSWAQLWDWSAILIAGSFGSIAVGLFVSSYTDTTKGRQGNLGIFLTIWFLAHLFTALARQGKIVHFYGWDVFPRYFYSLTAAVFGFWALAGATWRIGQDLQEGEAFWRLPAFMVFLSWYMLGIEELTKPWGAAYLLWIPAMLLYAASLWTRYGHDDVRRWQLAATSRQALDRAPIWLIGLATLILLALATASRIAFQGEASLRSLVLIPTFAARDLMFLQWCRLGRSRRPETMALAYWALAYVVPAAILGAFQATRYICWFAPNANMQVDATWNLLPPLLEAAVMKVALWVRIRRMGAEFSSATG